MSAKVSPIPEGFHTITPSLIVNDAAEASSSIRGPSAQRN
jgi:hypothetical protein